MADGSRLAYAKLLLATGVANAFHPLLGKHIQVDHWHNALHQPQTTAKAMLGQDERRPL